MGEVISITNVRTGKRLELDIWNQNCNMQGWQPNVVGWSIGERGSRAPIEIDGDLQSARLGIFPASNHVILWGCGDDPLPSLYLEARPRLFEQLLKRLRSIQSGETPIRARNNAIGFSPVLTSWREVSGLS